MGGMTQCKRMKACDFFDENQEDIQQTPLDWAMVQAQTIIQNIGGSYSHIVMEICNMANTKAPSTMIQSLSNGDMKLSK